MTDVLFTAGKGELQTGLAWAAKGLASRPAVPVLAGMRLQASQGRVTLAAFDYETTARAHAPAEVSAAGVILPRGTELVKAVKSLPGKRDALVTVMSDGGSLVLECEGVSASVELLAISEYPELPAMPVDAAVIDGGIFAGAVARVAPCASRDDTLPVLTTVRFEFGKDSGITLAATDRYRLAVEDVPATFVCDGTGGRAVSVPAAILAAYGKVSDRKGKVTVGLPVDPESDFVAFGDGARELITRTTRGDFVNYRHLLPASSDASAVVDAKALADAVKRAGDATERDAPILLRFYRNSVTVTAERDGKVASKATVPARLQAPAWEGARVIGWRVGFNPAYLRSLLLAVDGPARLSFRAGNGKPMLVTPEHGGAWRGLICTIRIEGAREWMPPAKPAEAREAQERGREASRRPERAAESAPALPEYIPGLKDRRGHDVRLKPGSPRNTFGQPYSITASVAGGSRHYVATWHPSGHRAEFGGKRGANKFVKAHEDALAALRAAERAERTA